MSSFKATLEVNGAKFDVSACSYSFRQETDAKNKPSSTVFGGSIHVTIDSSEDDKILGWMVDPYKKTNGTITFYKIDADSKMKELKFEDGYCTSFNETYSNGTGMSNEIIISAKKITVGSVTHDNSKV